MDNNTDQKNMKFMRVINVETKIPAVVPITNLKNCEKHLKKKIKLKTKKYYVSVGGKYITAVIDALGERENDLRVNQQKRLRIPALMKLEACTTTDDETISNSENVLKKAVPKVKKTVQLKTNYLEDRKEQIMNKRKFEDLYRDDVIGTYGSGKPSQNRNNDSYQTILDNQKKIIDNQEQIKTLVFNNTKTIKDVFQDLTSTLNNECQKMIKDNIIPDTSTTGLPLLCSCRKNDNGVEEIHVGRNIWVSKEKYDGAETNALNKFSRFVRNMSIVIFGVEILKQSSVSGQKERMNSKNTEEGGRPRLNPTKLLALQEFLYRVFVGMLFYILVLYLEKNHCNIIYFATKKSESEEGIVQIETSPEIRTITNKSDDDESLSDINLEIDDQGTFVGVVADDTSIKDSTSMELLATDPLL